MEDPQEGPETWGGCCGDTWSENGLDSCYDKQPPNLSHLTQVVHLSLSLHTQIVGGGGAVLCRDTWMMSPHSPWGVQCLMH